MFWRKAVTWACEQRADYSFPMERHAQTMQMDMTEYWNLLSWWFHSSQFTLFWWVKLQLSIPSPLQPQNAPHGDLNPRFLLFYIISPRGRSMILYYHLVAEWQHYTALNCAAWVVQQLGMWMYHYLLLPQLFSAVTIVGLAYLCMCTPVSLSNALSVSVFAQVNQGKTIVC